MEEDEFIDAVLDRYQEKKRYADFLEEEGSIMAESSRANQSIFRLRQTGMGAPGEGGASP